MRDLLSQTRALSAETIRRTVTAVGVLFAITAIVIVYNGLKTVLGGGPVNIGILQISFGVGGLLAIYLLIRLLAELVFSVHRANDRLMILNDELSVQRQTAAAPKPAPRKPAAKAKSSAKKAPAKPPASTDSTDS